MNCQTESHGDWLDAGMIAATNWMFMPLLVCPSFLDCHGGELEPRGLINCRKNLGFIDWMVGWMEGATMYKLISAREHMFKGETRARKNRIEPRDAHVDQEGHWNLILSLEKRTWIRRVNEFQLDPKEAPRGSEGSIESWEGEPCDPRVDQKGHIIFFWEKILRDPSDPP